ncbi:potassium transporter Kup [Mesorhizobium sp. BAC0120]|nr:potassium transporter Kup [Mesorhizobium sp. BAC0120]MDW6022650.1 potassium transporter Kup [Mesorhizobium sp. BAC0120]
MLGAIGVVYGDIGTSPIYTIRESLRAATGADVAQPEQVFGVLSLVFWALTVIVTVKYVVFVLRADNRGEGGILSLMALARSSYGTSPAWILLIGIAGSALFFGDAIITPAISVLSAVEGLGVVTPTFDAYVVPLTLLILAALFSVQRLGTGKVSVVFGPVTLAWFIAIAATGISHILDNPAVLAAINPLYIFAFLAHSPGTSFVTIGAVFLAVTGTEALYADLGHFGRKPIAYAWLWVAFPCLLLSYFGQGAFVLTRGGHIGHPFFEMNEGWALLPIVGLASAATIIASQAVISGAFSLTRQAVQLSILPRFEIQHTSERQAGQIYLPRVNVLLALAVMCLVVGFRESGALASAYGISVTGNMLVTTFLLAIVMYRVWKWELRSVLAVSAIFAFIDFGFFSANVIKVREGGWASILVAAVLFVIMATWVRGTRYLFDKTRRSEIPFEFLAEQMAKKPPKLVPGTAVFLTSDPQSAPTALMHSLKHYKVLHEQNVLLSVVTAQQPRVLDSERVSMEKLNELFMRVTLRFGYMEQPNIPKALAVCRKQGWKFDIMSTSFFLSRRSLKLSATSGMPIWQDRLFIQLARTAADATEYFQIPTGRVVEIGTQVTV